jgi:hypothetical protein
LVIVCAGLPSDKIRNFDLDIAEPREYVHFVRKELIEMRKEFAWYFGASDSEIKSIWEKGLLTVDANVLLDLYRYHANTRDSLLACIERFQRRLWLSRQAADEFFRNRSKVIISASAGFKQAMEELTKLGKALDATVAQLQTNRIIPGDIAANLRMATRTAISSAEERVATSGSAHPKFLDSDPLLEKLLTMFENAVGPNFTEEELKKVKLEAEQRKKMEVPPGFLDEHKAGDRPFGDFFLWRQVLDHAKAKSTPIILVTSERKEDWWERHSGQTVGPRLELLREAHEYSGQRILIYQTDRFLEFATERLGGTVDTNVVEEIRAVDKLRSTANVVREAVQSVQSCSPTMSAGLLTVDIVRPVFMFTASGHFEPNLLTAPSMRVRLVENPQLLPRYRLSAGSGTNHDFNIHLKSIEYGATLPAGKYVFEYGAEIASGQSDSRPIEGTGG